MSSRASTAPIDDDDDDLRNMLDAMNQSSPVAQKRTYGTMAGDDDTPSDSEQRAGTAPSFALVNHNVVAAARHYAERKRLRGDQLTELDIFLNVSLIHLLLYGVLTCFS